MGYIAIYSCVRVYGYIGGVEDVAHWLFECDAWDTEHQPLLLSMKHMANDFDILCDDYKLALHSFG